MTINPRATCPRPPFDTQPQRLPGGTGKMLPTPDDGQTSDKAPDSSRAGPH